MHLKKSHLLALSIIIILAISCNRDRKEEVSTQKLVSVTPDSLYAVSIIDGDTFMLSDSSIVRIALIDTPERGEPLYNEAGDYLASLILNRRVSLRPVGAGVDSYGRILAEVMLDSVNIGYNIIDKGYGLLYLYNDNNHIADNYLSGQNSAIKRRAGIWALPEPAPEEFYASVRGSHRFHRPLCPHLKNVNPLKLKRFADRKEALKPGLSPCRSCKP